MRWPSAVLGLVGLGALGLSSCDTTSDGCVTYCAAVADALARCDLVDTEEAFDRDDCEERTSDVDESACTDTADELAAVDQDDCAKVVDSFCPDAALDCPDECFGECCSDADCPSESPACELGSCTRCTAETAASYCGPTMSCYLGECLECTEETESFACAEGEGCQYNYCHQRCFVDADCGDFRTCSSDFCSEPIGTPCPDGDFFACGGAGSCVSVDAANQPVPFYCTIYCSESEPCPLGYDCVDGAYQCLQSPAR